MLLILLITLPIVIANLCSHCECDSLSATIMCSRPSLLIRTVSMLPNVQQLHLNNMILPQPPHFLYHHNLRVLRMSKCQMTEIPASAFLPLPGLEIIDVSNNQLETLPATLLRSLKNLRVLILANNRISNLDALTWILAEGVVLEQLDLSGNPLAISTTMTIFPPVRQLFMSDTRMESVNATDIVFKAQSDKCENTRCRHLSLENLDTSIIKTIDFSANPGLSIDNSALDVFENVTYMDVSSARLPSKFETWLENQSRVRSLNISHCHVKLREEDTWTSCGQNIHSIDVSGMGLKILKLDRLCGLSSILARNNLLSSMVVDATSIESIHVDHNMFSEFPTALPGTDLEKLHTLSISNNLLTNIPRDALVGYSMLQHFDVSHNQISEIDSHAFPTIGMGLVSLDLSANQLSLLPHPILPSLLFLDLSSNSIAHFDPHFFTGLPMLQQLRLSSNPPLFSRCQSSASPCWSDHLDELTSLVDLDLSNSGLSFSLHLAHLTTLRSLLLRGNEIGSFERGSLPADLRTLDLGENLIQFTGNFSEMNKLRDLRIDQNPLRCDCQLYDIVPHLLNQSQIEDPLLYYCFSGSWQYPLYPYLVSVQPCTNSMRNFYSILITTFILSILIVLGLLGGFLLYRRFYDHSHFFYKRISMTENAVRL